MSTNVDQPTAAPTSKVTAASLSAAAGIFLVWAAGELGHPVSAEVAAAVVALLAAAGGYFKRERIDGLTVHRAGERGLSTVELLAGLCLLGVILLIVLAID
jgi:hypothetical protein